MCSGITRGRVLKRELCLTKMCKSFTVKGLDEIT